MTKKTKHNLYAFQKSDGAMYDKGDIKLAKLIGFLIGFCANFLLLCITFYLTDLFAK